jgi:hypothetical protein
LEKALDWTRRDAAANNESEQVSAKDSEHAADRGPNQALQTHGTQSPLKYYDRSANEQAYDRVQIVRQVERTDKKADNTDNYYK